jgi:uncharacterized protein (TIGR03066 family)
MKSKGKTRGVRKQAQGVSPSAVPRTAPRRLLGMPRWVVILLFVSVVAGVSFAAFDRFIPARIPPKLVGEWRVTEGPVLGMTLEFRRDGAMLGKAMIAGKEAEIEGTAEVTGDTLRTTTKNPYTGAQDTGVQTIVTLSDSEFVTRDSTGTRIVMRRVP